MKVNKKEYNKDEVRKFFKESRERIKEHKIDDRKEPLNSIIKAVEKMVHVVAIAEEISKEDKMEDDKMLEKHEQKRRVRKMVVSIVEILLRELLKDQSRRRNKKQKSGQHEKMLLVRNFEARGVENNENKITTHTNYY